jgi:hypothetical protein
VTNGGDTGTNGGILRRGYAILVPITGIVVIMNSLTARTDFPQAHAIEPWIWEITSGAALLAWAWIPAAACQVAPLSWPMSRRVLAATGGWHVGAALLFAMLHVAGFVLLRSAAYRLSGLGDYRYGALSERFPYELRKDLLTYATVVGIFQAAAHWRRAGGRTVAPPRPAEASAPVRQTLTFDILEGSNVLRVPVASILALQSAGNYVEFILAEGRQPLMRGTLADMESRLTSAGFVRVHRSWLINPAHLSELRKGMNGTWSVRIDAIEIPISRRYQGVISELKQDSDRPLQEGRFERG